MQISLAFSPRHRFGPPLPGLPVGPEPVDLRLNGETMYVMRDQEVFGERDRVRQVYRVVRGAVRAFRVFPDGCRTISDFYLPGDIFGIHVKAEHRVATEAVTDTMLVIAQRSSLRHNHDQEATRGLWNLAMSGLRRSQDHAATLRRRGASGRVAGFLVDMVARMGQDGYVELPMSRQDIADYLGLTNETVSRTLAELHNSGAITLTGNRGIHLRQPHALAELCD
jgi:CRP/FNR family transcriptional regulator, nitrogen fixation regulation protein